MNILKKLGIIVAAHLAVLVLAFLPACQSSSAYASRSSSANTGSATSTPATSGPSRVEVARTLTPIDQNAPSRQPAPAISFPPTPSQTITTPNAPAPATGGVIYTYPASTESFAAPVATMPVVTYPPQTAAGAAAPTVNREPGTGNLGGTAALANAPALPAETLANTTQTTYTVVANDSPWKIARKFGISTAALLAANNFPPNSNPKLQIGQKLIIPGKAAAPAAASAVPGTIVYRVKSGDSLSAIAARNGTTPERIMALNKLTSPTIRVDQEILLPSVEGGNNGAAYAAATPAATAVTSGTTITHIVKPGESLGSIAAYYGASRNEIATVNHIANPNKLRDGTKLTIPNAKKNLASATVASGTTATTTAATTTTTTATQTTTTTHAPATTTPNYNSPISPIAPATNNINNDSPIAPASPFSPITPATGTAPYSPPVNTIDNNAPLPFGAAPQ